MSNRTIHHALNQLKFDFARQPDSDALCQRLILAYLAAGNRQEAWNAYQTHTASLSQTGMPLSDTLLETGLFLRTAPAASATPRRLLLLRCLWVLAILPGAAVLMPSLRSSSPPLTPQPAPAARLSASLSEKEDGVRHADRLMIAGADAYHKGDYPLALAFEYGGLALFEAWEHQDGQSQALAGLGQVYQAQGELKRADERYRRAWELRQKNPDPLVRAHMLELRAGLNRMQGKTMESGTQLRECLRLREQHQDRGGVASCYLGLAEVALVRKELTEADRWQQRALQEARALNLKPLQAAIWMSQARLALLRKDYEGAREKAAAGRAFWQAQKHPRWIAAGLLLSSRIASADGQTAEAEVLAAKCQRAYEAVGDKYGTMQAMLQRALALRRQQRSSASLPLLQKIRSYAQENDAALLLSEMGQ